MNELPKTLQGKFIVKIQKSVYGPPSVLIYNKNKDLYEIIDKSEQEEFYTELTKLMLDDLKGYYTVRIEDSKLIVLGEVGPQSW